MSRFWTPMPHFRGGRAFLERNLLGAVAALCVFSLAACGESSSRGYAGSPSSDTLQPVVAPPGASASPPLPGTTGVAKDANGLPILGSKGVNTALFANKLGDEEARLDRLENAVQEMRNDFDAMSPAILRLISIEADIQNLITQLDVLTGKIPAGDGVAPIEESALEEAPVQPADVPLPPKPGDEGTPVALDPERVNQVPPKISETPQLPAQEAAASVSGSPAPETTPALPTATAPSVAASAATPAAVPAPAASVSTGGIAVQAVRVGEHPGKVRIVLDVKGKTPYTADLDNQEKILVVELPQAGWNAQAQQNYSGNPVLASYKTEATGEGGTRLIIQLKAPTSIAYKSAVNNTDGVSSKIIIDLAKP